MAQVEDVRILEAMPIDVQTSQKTAVVDDTIDLPIIDDFSQKTTIPNPSIWTDRKVYINSTIPTDLLSIGAASFDGTNEYGYPYDINKNGSDTLADVLTSKHIRFTPPVTDVYLTFLYQKGGLGEFPEAQDSLVVEFWSVQDTAWEQVWAVKGNSQGSKFRAASIPLADPKFLIDGFRFRFGAYGALNGAFDVWNIDYVQLDQNRTPNDTTIIEPAFVKTHPYLTYPFSHIPWFHYQNQAISNEITFTYMRNGPPPPGGWALNLGKYFINKDGVQVKDRLTVPVITNLNHNVPIDFEVPVQPFSIANPTGEFNLFMRTWFDGTAEGLRNNDTVEISIPFKNYYAFDDGSAERAYGILNQTNARLAFQFTPLQPDTLRGLLINFAHAGTDATDNKFRIAIWEDNFGEPGNPIFISDSLYQPEYAPYHNGFMPFDLDTGIFISGSVFVGMVQKNAEAIHVGLDLNTVDATKKFYGSGFVWLESLVPGTVMIRPYLKYTPLNFAIEEPEQNLKIKVYPNPANDFIKIEVEDLVKFSWKLLNSTGQIVDIGTRTELSTLHLPRGMYFIQIEVNGQVATEKLILQ